MLKKLRPVVCGFTLQWSRGVHMNPKEYHVAAVSWLNIWKKISPRLALLGSLWISPLTTNERTLDTLIFHIRIFNLWWVHKNVDLWYCHISILIKINHCFITWIIYVTSFIRHLCVTLYKWMGKACCGKSAAKNTEINKTHMFWFWICHFVYSYHKTILFSALKQRKCKIRMVIVWSKWRDMKNDVPPLFSKPNIIFQFFFRWF